MKIAILSRNPKLYSTRRFVEAGLSRGHEMMVIDHLKCSVIIEEGKPAIHFEGKPVKGIDAIIPRIGASVSFYGAAIVRQFEIMEVFSTVKSQAIVRSRDKLRTLQILSKSGIGLPKTAFAYQPAQIDSVLNHVGGTPAVIKLLEGTQGIGVVLAETKKAAKSVMEAFYGLNANVLIQEYIKESSGSDVRAFIVDGKVVGAMRRTGMDGEFRSNLHRGGTGEKIKLTDLERNTALKAARALGLSIAGVDMLQSNRGPLILEVNSSPGLEGIEAATNTDIAGKIIEFVEKKIIRTNQKDKIGI